MSSSFPIIKPLKRLNVIEGLEVTVERWNIAHEYHKERQNIYYQSLHQAGIVCGLGVCVIPPPVDVSAQYRNHRWVQIQPGIAIDNLGNIIVVPQPLDFYISSQVNEELSRLIYLVIIYIDPQGLQLQNITEIAETFQIDEKNQPPQDGEIELCRIQLEGEEIVLGVPQNVFNPAANTLDLRYRQQAQSKPLSMIRIAVLAGDATGEIEGLNRLLKSIKGLYPVLEGDREVKQVVTTSNRQEDLILNYDVVYLSQQRAQQLSLEEFNLLQTYLNQGGVIWMQIPTENTKLEELRKIEYQLLAEINQIESVKVMKNSNQTNSGASSDYLTKIQPVLEIEVKEIQQVILAEINQISLNVQKFAQRLGILLESWEQLSGEHPLKNEPFLFVSLPIIKQQPIQVLCGGGLVVIVGNISAVFGGNNDPKLSREIIRTAQEFGINILHFAYRRRQMQQSLQSRQY